MTWEAAYCVGYLTDNAKPLPLRSRMISHSLAIIDDSEFANDRALSKGECYSDKLSCPKCHKPMRLRNNNMVRISSRTWTLAQIEDLAALIAAGSTAANAAMALRRSITVVRAKARNLGTPFQMIAEDQRV